MTPSSTHTAPILLTAFDPFGGEETNASQVLLAGLPEEVAGVPLHRVVLPTSFARGTAALLGAIDQVQPRAVVCLGQAAGRVALTPERVAINIADASIPDNDGAQPLDQPLVVGGPAAYFTTLPVKALIQAMRDTGYTAELSNTAGTFVCNAVMYRCLHYLATTGRAHIPAGFLHVPALGDLDVARAGEALRAALVVVAGGEEGIPLATGKTH